MNDYLEIFKKFKETKDISDLIEDIEKLRYLYYSNQFEEMRKHINNLSSKYLTERIIWNSVNTVSPQTDKQHFINAENFLMAQGVKKIVEKIDDYKEKLSNEEIAFIKSMSKIVE